MSGWVLALHSSTETLGIALVGAEAPLQEARVLCRSLGRALTNELVISLQQLLPADQWTGIRRLAVATGPGGFTGTRLTVVLARTLAQQLGAPLHGVSSFALMAARLNRSLAEEHQQQPFWITQVLPRRGVVAGCYRLHADQVEEISTPHLLPQGQVVSPSVEAQADPARDVERLLLELRFSQGRAEPLPWASVLPIYPTSPVGAV